MESLQRDAEALRRIPLFSGLVPARLKLIAYAAEVVHFEPGEVIARQGEPPDAIDIIAEGEAEVWLTHADGRSVRLCTIGRHSLLGEAALLCHGCRTATVRAKGQVVTFRISTRVFLDLLREHPEIRIQVMRGLARRLEHVSVTLQQGRIIEERDLLLKAY